MYQNRGYGRRNDPRVAVVVPGVWMTFVGFLSIASIIVTAQNSQYEDAKVITGFVSVFYILFLFCFCATCCTPKPDKPKKFKLYFTAMMILGISNIIFCAINLSVNARSNQDITVLTMVQTGIVLGFSVICTICCAFCQFCTDLGKKLSAPTNVNVQL